MRPFIITETDLTVKIDVRDDEQLQDLLRGRLVILQKKDGYRFSLDPLLLASFVELKDRDRVIDLGAGSGVLPIVLAYAQAARSAKFVGLEINAELADMAARSVRANKLDDAIEIVRGDIREVPARFTADSFDVVVSNPPFIPVGQGRVNLDDQRAQARHEVSVTLAEMVQAARFLARGKGRVYFIYPSKRLTDLLAQCREHRLEPRRMRMVHPRPDRDAELVMVEAVRDAKPGLRVTAPLYVHEQDGKYTPEAARMLGETVGER